uniref:HTH cro/C1-type domain-containing protein n=2 Tax=Geminigeraceae TaxID=589343 RepID=A0A6T7MXR2_9CRYP|mmetsp:Transcript_14628/g.33600  ORF Transcript_14628/g.33600 Transcript_14628/m.33600 type:complete len:127 (+) Transcript_14628:35-415(+)
MAHIVQDWEPVVLRKNASSTSAAKGGAPAGPKGGTSKLTAAGVDIRKLEADDDDAPMKLPTASLDLRLAIQQARNAKGLSQKDFASKMMVPPKTVQDYESGKAIPNNQLIAKMEKVLGCKLPRASK